MCKAKEMFTKDKMEVLEAIDIYVGKTDYVNKTKEENEVIFAKRHEAISEFYDFRFAIDRENRDDEFQLIHAKIWNHDNWAKGIADEIHAELIAKAEEELFMQMLDEEEMLHTKRNSSHVKRRKNSVNAKKRKQKSLKNASEYCTTELKPNGSVKSIKTYAKKPNAYKRNNRRVEYVPETETEFIPKSEQLYSRLTEIERQMEEAKRVLRSLEADYNGTLQAYYDAI